MKTLFIVLYLCVAAHSSLAQLSIGPVAGFGVSTKTTKNYGYTFNTKYINFNVGATTTLSSKKRFAIQSTLVYERMEPKRPTLNLSGIASYKPYTKTNNILLIGAGPLIAMPLSYNKVYFFDTTSQTGETFRLHKLLNFGVIANVRYQFKSGIFLMSQFQVIVTNMLSRDIMERAAVYELDSWRYYNYGLSAGYLFQTSRKNILPTR